uniref:Uncharacterized protein n=1 Tax=Solanum lycopersicum TaxID=4081 RepID=A0A3Q7EXA2_SOLLC
MYSTLFIFLRIEKCFKEGKRSNHNYYGTMVKVPGKDRTFLEANYATLSKVLKSIYVANFARREIDLIFFLKSGFYMFEQRIDSLLVAWAAMKNDGISLNKIYICSHIEFHILLVPFEVG